MASITIRDVPADTRDELAARAARSGRSLQENVHSHLMEWMSRPDPEDLIARVRSARAAVA